MVEDFLKSSEVVKDEHIVTAEYTGSRVIVWDPDEGSRLYQLGYFGKPIGIRKPKTAYFNRPSELTLLETLYLLERNKIQLLANGEKMDVKTFQAECNQHLDNFDDLFVVYSHLRSLRYIVRPGLKFGAHFSVYQQGPGIDHAPFLVSVFPRTSTIKPLDLVRAGRLATSVRKRFVIATVLQNQEISYYIFEWHKP
ncbi:MAG: tRNA-intron lyase [Candidatus Hodarchaeota archaeon]